MPIQNGGSSTHRHRVLKSSGIDFIDGVEVAHAGEEDVALDNIVQAGAGGFQDSTKVVEDLFLLIVSLEHWNICRRLN